MGVRGLQTFMKSVPNGEKMINILQAIKERKVANPSEKCVIIIDLFGIRGSYLFENHVMDALCGFRYNIIINVFEQFFKQLIEAGAELKFFRNGFDVSYTEDTALNKLNRYFEEDVCLFKVLASGEPLEQLQEKELLGDYTFDGEIGVSLRSSIDNRILLEKYGVVYCLAKGKCDQAMATYATKNNAFAILTNDSDILIFPGTWKIWNAHMLDMDNLTILEYNKSALISALKIQSNQLPVLATLMGCKDHVPFELTSKFHSSLGKFGNRFFKVAKYMIACKVQPSAPNFKNELLNIAEIMDSENSKDIYGRMLKSIEYYECANLEEESSEIKTKLRYLGYFGYELYSSPYYLPDNYLLLCNYKKRYGFPTHSDAIISIVCRAYGFILTLFNSERSIASKMITTKENYESKFEMKSYDAEYPSKELKYPMYPAFYEDFSDDMTKMKILLWIFGIDDSKCDQILNLPDSITPDLLSLLYFTERGLIDNDVADSCLITCYAEAFKLIPKNVEYPKYVDEKLYTFSKLFSLIYQNLTKCARMINFQKLCGILTFDSVYFQWTHQEYVNNGFNNKRIKLMDEVKQYRLYD